MEDQVTQYVAETLSADLAQELAGDDRLVERVVVEQATPDHFMVRVWFAGQEEYEPYQLRLGS